MFKEGFDVQRELPSSSANEKGIEAHALLIRPYLPDLGSTDFGSNRT